MTGSPHETSTHSTDEPPDVPSHKSKLFAGLRPVAISLIVLILLHPLAEFIERLIADSPYGLYELADAWEILTAVAIVAFFATFVPVLARVASSNTLWWCRWVIGLVTLTLFGTLDNLLSGR